MQRDEPTAQHLPAADSSWLGLVYDDLRMIAARQLANERPEHTLRATELVHEAWLRFRTYENVTVKGKAHFLALASQAMRRVLIDHARRRSTTRHGGQGFRVELTDQIGVVTEEMILDLDRALLAFVRIDAETAAMVELRYFGGATTVEIGESFGYSERTIRDRLAYARSWLRSHLSES
ncbi:MAG: sigma-70 family RNA polymerase sigma factor [Candidatus Eisenbacteria bacterium]|uniref:Sigma-70 family RNA polymerase sigma factor n=1 Tax=Eiseniibacteriota bacterium TaxID=2212470 RepID=A0A956SF81_UNCEI|nr:sigma-70 family RNA polymerase sigma factor [Candidatus Eisenbacteria bacterium]